MYKNIDKIRHLRWKHAVHSLPTCHVCHNRNSNCYFLFFYAWTVRRLCVTGTNLGQRKHNQFRAWAYLCLALDWRWSDVLLASTFTRGKMFTFLNMQKMCAEVDAQYKWITFIWRSRKIINEFWRTPSESQRTAQNSSFFVRWTCVMVCVTGPLLRNSSVTHNKNTIISGAYQLQFLYRFCLCKIN